MKSFTKLFVAGIGLSLALNSCGQSSSPEVRPDAMTATVEPQTQTPIPSTPMTTPVPKGKTIVVTSAEDSGAGTLRQALLDAQTGDTITFDPVAFPPMMRSSAQ